jgi:hypothetical protein
VAVQRLPDYEAIAAELAHLRHRRLDLLRQQEKLVARMAAFPNDFGCSWARSMAAEVEAMAARITELEAQLLLHR